MANEYEILTENQAGDSWVDDVPGRNVTTGYQSQNTNIEARTNGLDLSSIRVQGDDILIEISGPIDVNGLPFVATQTVVLTPTSFGTYYIRLVDGSSNTQKSVELTTTAPFWDASKNGFYNSGNRYFNYVIFVSTIISIVRISNTPYGSLEEAEGFPFGFARWYDIYDNWRIEKRTGLSFPAGNLSSFCRNYINRNSYNANSSTIYYLNGITDSVINSFSTPASGNGGIYHRKNIDVLYWIFGSTLFLLDPYTGTVQNSYSITGALNVVSVTYDEDKNIIYLSDDGAGLIHEVNGSTYNVIGTISQPALFGGSTSVEFDFVKNRLLFLAFSADNTWDIFEINTSLGAANEIIIDVPIKNHMAIDPYNGNLYGVGAVNNKTSILGL